MKRKAARRAGKKRSDGGARDAQARGAGGGRRKVASKGAKAGPPGKKKHRGAGPKKSSRQRSDAPKRDVSTKPRPARERLQKVLASAGLGSRRQCEELILTGRVEVDREVVTELGTRVDPDSQRIRVDGVELRRPKTVWYALNKPTGVVCTNRDPGGRPRAVDLVPETRERLFPVGRLDLNSEGLLLLTNDGDLANRLTHPRYEITKTYRVLVAGHPTVETLKQLRRGVYLSEGLAKVTGARIKHRYKKSTVLEMTLQEGRNREIRRVLARVGHKVMRLVRVSTGPIKLGELESGNCRRLTGQEVDALRRCVREGKS